MSNTFPMYMPPGQAPPHSVGGGIVKEQILAECKRRGKLLHEMDPAELDQISQEAAARIHVATDEGRDPSLVREQLARDDRSTASTLVERSGQATNPDVQEEKSLKTKMSEGWKRYKRRSEGIILWGA